MKKAASEKNRYKLNNWKVVERNKGTEAMQIAETLSRKWDTQRKSVNNETAQAEELELLWFIYEIRQMIWNSKKRSEPMRRPLNDDKSKHMFCGKAKSHSGNR